MSQNSVEMKEKDLSYEELVEKLEEIVERLEEDGVTLEEALSSYEYGIHLVQQCNDILDKAELRISEISTLKSEIDPEFDDDTEDWDEIDEEEQPRLW